MILEDALNLLYKNIDENLYHTDYERVVGLAELYKMLITGENIEPLLRQFIRREDKDMFEQRVRLTQIITPAVINSIRTPFTKVTRNKKIIKKLDLRNDKLNKDVDQMIINFYGDESDNKGLDYWFKKRFTNLTFTDPNAFIVIEFDSFDFRYEKPKPRPFEVSSTEAINFSYKNNKLQWLLVRQDIKFMQKGRKLNGYKYTLYDADYTLTLTRVGIDYVPLSGEEMVKLKGEKEFYILNVYQPKMGFCPAIRAGYVEDLETDGRTCVAPFHPAMPFFQKSIKSVSEMDLSVSLHVFPQKMQYVRQCDGNGKEKCFNGCSHSGDPCQTCGGLGFIVHTSAQDALYFPMPADKQDMLPLSELLEYKSPPTDILTFLDNYIDKLEVKAHRAIFNSDIYVNPGNTIAKTATEKNLESESVNDTITPFATRISSMYVFFVWAFAVLADADPAKGVIEHSFPADLQLETVATLLEKLKAANESKAPGFVRDSFNVDLAEALYIDDETGLMRFKTKRRFYPFNGKTDEEIQVLLNGALVSEFNKIFYANYELVYNLLENEFDTDFYLWTAAKQWPEIERTVNEVWDDIKEQKADGINEAFAQMRAGKAEIARQANPGEIITNDVDKTVTDPLISELIINS